MKQDQNPNVKDINVPIGAQGCSNADQSKMNMVLSMVDSTIDGCWQNVHSSEMNVYDFSSWASDGANSHPGNTETWNPIKHFAEEGKFILTFPQEHEMWRWSDSASSKLEYMGRFGDVVAIIDLPDGVRQDVETYDLFSSVNNDNNVTDGRIICGSPGEVANSYNSMHTFSELSSIIDSSKRRSEIWYRQRKQVWTEIVMHGE